MTLQLQNLIGAQWVNQSSAERHQILNPADAHVAIAEFGYSTAEDVAAAVAAASAAFSAWRKTPVVKRCRILFRCKELLESRVRELAELLVAENGKTYSEAEGSIRRGLEVVEFAAGMPSLAKGEYVEDIASGVDGYLYREPLGVVAGACPFNFPAMIPLWMFPIAVACGNTFVLKPSEKCPATATLLAEIFLAGGLPPGVLNVVQGDGKTFQSLIAAPEVQAVSFVGSTLAAKSVWETATTHGKRVQSLGGAKNYIVVMPDADRAATVKAVIGSTYGCAGERCMASSVLILVGDDFGLLEDIRKAAENLRLGSGTDASTQMGPLISSDHKKRVETYIRIGMEEGAELVLDGRQTTVSAFPNGNFLGACIFDKVHPEMRIAKEEIFGPVLCVMRAKDLQQAIDLANRSAYGNGASIFTTSGAAAREFRTKVECGMIGINAGVPAPMAFFSFGGRKNSLFGDLRAHGNDAIEFYTRKKAVIEQWTDPAKSGSIWGK